MKHKKTTTQKTETNYNPGLAPSMTSGLKMEQGQTQMKK